MRTIAAGLKAHAEQSNTALAWMVLITRKWDGAKVGLTSWSQDIDFDLGGLVTYKARPGLVMSLTQFTQGLSDSSAEFDSVLDESVFLKSDVDGGAWRDASYETFLVNPLNPGSDLIRMDKGRFGSVTRNGIALTIEILSIANQLQQVFTETITAECPFVLGSTKLHGGGCKVRLKPPLWSALTDVTLREDGQAETGSVVRPTIFNNRHFECVGAGQTGASEPAWNSTIGETTSDGTATWRAFMALTAEVAVATVTSQREFTVTGALDSRDSRYNEGRLIFTSGDNTQFPPFEVKAWVNATQTVTLHRKAQNLIQPGDQLEMAFGCNHILAAAEGGDCEATFRNWTNYGGIGLKSPNLTVLKEVIKL